MTTSELAPTAPWIDRREALDAWLAPIGEDAVVGLDSCQRHKPDPEPVRLALDLLGYEPHEALFLGDSPHDIAAGNAAGVVTVAALWGPFPRPALEAAAPRHLIRHIAELPPLVNHLTAAPSPP